MVTELTFKKLDIAVKVLQESYYAAKVTAPAERTNWNDYILQILKQLKSADKANWHHRLAARVRPVSRTMNPDKAYLSRPPKYYMKIQRTSRLLPLR
jgi:hypothetical protein